MCIRDSIDPATGNPVYARPTVLVIHRDDHRFLLESVIPKRGGTEAGYDLVIASQPYRCLLYTSPNPRDRTRSRMPSSA